MSGIEVAGLVFGVIPIIVEILKSYRTARDRLNTFRKHTQIANEVQLRYRVAATNFSNDCQLLLKGVIDDACELSQMVGDPQHSGWQDPQLESRFRAFLEPDHTLFEDIITLIQNVLRDTEAALKDCSEQPSGSGLQHTTAQRLYLAFNISRKENRYRKWLDTLDCWNEKLSVLRKQRCELQRTSFGRSGLLNRKAVPQKYGEIQVASHRLHKSLENSWSCTNVSHTGHHAKLSIEATAEYGNVRLDIVIASREEFATTTQVEPPLEVPICLQVQTLTTCQPATKPDTTTTKILDTLRASVKTTSHMACTTASASVTPTAKRKFAGHTHAAAIDDNAKYSKLYKNNKSKSVITPSDQQHQSFVTFDLKATDSICSHLSQNCTSASSCVDSCLGYLEYLEATLSSRFTFYDASKNTDAQKVVPLADRKALPINTLLKSLRTFHQLTLAYRLAIATLQYHSTSWLAPDWGLRDISYFDNSTPQTPDELSERLESLHLSTQFSGRALSVISQATQDEKDLRCNYGIRNLPLAKLGVALLEIGCQEEINSLSPASAPHDIIRARKVLIDPPLSMQHLGKHYLKIVQKCIDCDFSCGDDLMNEDLRNAVYTDIVCGLEGMTADWKRFLGIT